MTVECCVKRQGVTIGVCWRSLALCCDTVVGRVRAPVTWCGRSTLRRGFATMA